MTRYRIDPSRSRVWVDARSSLHPIHSEAVGVEGWFEADGWEKDRVDPTVGSKAHLEFEVEKLSSGNPLYDREMRRRADIGRYPLITGDLTAIKETGTDGRYQVTGDVSFRGQTNSYTDEMTVSFPDDGAVRFEGSHDFDIRQFGMQPPKFLALRVYPEVTVKVSLVARSGGSD